jgi:hypothetical protein
MYTCFWEGISTHDGDHDHLCGLVARVPGCRLRGPGFDSWQYQIFWGVVGLEWGPLSLMSKFVVVLVINNRDSGLEIREYCCGDPLHWPRDTLYAQKLALTSLTSGCRLVGIILSMTKATEFVVDGDHQVLKLPHEIGFNNVTTVRNYFLFLFLYY